MLRLEINCLNFKSMTVSVCAYVQCCAPWKIDLLRMELPVEHHI